MLSTPTALRYRSREEFAGREHRVNGTEKVGDEIAHVEHAKGDACSAQVRTAMAADVAGKPAVGEYNIGREGFERGVEKAVEPAPVGTLPSGDGAARGIEQRVGNPALSEAEFAAMLAGSRRDRDV